MIELRSRRENVRNALSGLAGWVAILAVAALVGAYASMDQRRALLLAGLLLVGTALLLWLTRVDVVASHRWIPYAWMALMLAPDHRFTFHSLDPSPSNLTVDNIVQLIVYTAVAVLVIRSRRMVVSSDPRHLRKGPFILWPLVALLSTVWSIIPLFTFVRALQLFVVIGLALLMVRIWLASPQEAAVLWRDTLRVFVGTVTLLVLLGVATGFLWQPRFTWPGANAGVAAIYAGVGLLILIAGGRSFLRLRTSGYVIRLVLFSVALYLAHARGVSAAVVVAIAVLLLMAARTNPLKSFLGTFYYTIAIVLLVIVARSDIISYALRGGTTTGVTSLDGRIPLWTLSIQLVTHAGKWLTGFGYGAARVILPAYVPWAGTAHSYWIELLVAIGIVGPLLAAADVIFVLRHASSRRAIAAPALTLSILALLVVASLTQEGLAFPGISFVTLAMLHVPVLTQVNSTRGRARVGEAGSGAAAPHG